MSDRIYVLKRGCVIFTGENTYDENVMLPSDVHSFCLIHYDWLVCERIYQLFVCLTGKWRNTVKTNCNRLHNPTCVSTKSRKSVYKLLVLQLTPNLKLGNGRCWSWEFLKKECWSSLEADGRSAGFLRKQHSRKSFPSADKFSGIGGLLFRTLNIAWCWLMNIYQTT